MYRHPEGPFRGEVRPANVVELEIRPIGSSTARVSVRSNRGSILAYPATRTFASTELLAETRCAGSMGLALPLKDWKITGTAFASERLFQ